MPIVTLWREKTVSFSTTTAVSISSNSCVTDSLGNCNVTLSSNTDGNFTAAVSINAGNLSNSPVSYHFAMGVAEPTNSVVSVSNNPSIANGVDTVVISATIRDVNNVAIENEVVNFASTSNVTLGSSSCTTDANGVCNVTVISTVADSYSTTVTINAGILSNSPATYTFVSGPVSIINSTVSVTGQPAVADGSDTLSLTAQIVDANNNVISGETVSFVFPNAVASSANSCVTNASGQCSVTIFTTVADSYTSTVSVSAGIVDNSTSYRFGSGAAIVANSNSCYYGKPCHS